MLRIGDKIKYVKENSLIGMPLGTVMTVTDIKGTVVAVDANCEIGNCKATIQGVMSYDEVERYFEKVTEEIQKNTPWTEWQIAPTSNEIIQCLNSSLLCRDCPLYAVCDYEERIEYKTNGRKIMVRLQMDDGKWLKSHSTCHRTDSFDLNTGLKVALARLNVKIAQERLNAVIKQIG